MKVTFNLIDDNGSQPLTTTIDNLVVAGWAGRDRDAIEHHIEELAAIGVPRPSSVPLYYRIAANQLIQDSAVQAVGPDSSGETETFVFNVNGVMYVSLASDHTDRKLEAHSVALSKQLCIKPLATDAWRFDDVADYWDELVVRAYIEEDGMTVTYQEGTLASLQSPLDLIKQYTGGTELPEGTGMTCGTVAVIGGIRPAQSFTMELFDPRRQRTLRHAYHVDILPHIA